jgi:tetratricopeptide (TPR) repeat protein
VLRLLGLFTRPAPLSVLYRLRHEQSIPGLTDRLGGDHMDRAVVQLRHLRILAAAKEWEDQVLDAHPLVREHYRQSLLQQDLAPSASQAHSWLFRYFQDAAVPRPRSVHDAMPLLDSIVHGCKAGRHQEAFELYRQRLLVGEGEAVGRLPGMMAPMLTALANFFEPADWGKPIKAGPGGEGLDAESQRQALQHAVLFLTVGRGHGAKEVQNSLAALHLMISGSGSAIERFRTVYSQWNFHLAGSSLDPALESARQLFEIAGASPADFDAGFRIAAHSAQGAALMYMGRLAEASSTLRAGIVLIPTSELAWGRVLFAQDPPVACGGYLAWTEAIRGNLRQALDLATETLAYARRRAHPFSLACALHFASIIRRIRRESAESLALAREQIQVSQAHSFPLWHSAGVANEGYALIEQGALDTGLRTLADGVRQWHIAVPGLVKSHWQCLLADGQLRCAVASQAPSARRHALEQAELHMRAGTEWARSTGELYFLAELLRVQGMLALAHRDPVRAVELFEESIAVATSQDARLFVLRSTIAWARLRIQLAAPHGVAERLRAAMEGVAEGRSCADWLDGESLCLAAQRIEPGALEKP